MCTYCPTKGASNFSKDVMSNFSPITPVCSINLSATVIPPKSEAKNSSLELKLRAASANSCANFTKFSFLPTKSVSQPNTIATPDVASAFTFATAAPSEESLSALFSATF